MEVSDEVFDLVLTPTAAYSHGPQETQASTPWELSCLNPKNRVDSLALPHPSLWRFEGVEFSGARYFILPEFAYGKPPLRIDVFLPRHKSQPEELRRSLQSNLSVLYQGSDALKLDFTKHVLRALEVWSKTEPEFEKKYSNMPFGSRVVVENISSSVHEMRIHLVSIYDIERQWLTLTQLKDQWAIPATQWPPMISIEDLSLCRQSHEAITIVQAPRHRGTELLVFKSLTRDVQYMYHELRMLITMPENEHVLGKPLYIVTKRCRFGRKVGVCGFVVEYYQGGTLRDLLQSKDEVVKITMDERFRWALQLTKTLLFIKMSPLGYYPDLKPDNIILRTDAKHRDILLIDLEQRGGWYSWTPREVSYIEFVEYIASASPEMVGEDAVNEHAELMKALVRDWEPLARAHKYNSEKQKNGYSTAWSQLSQRERESAQVYMLGKLLWCLFESKPSINCGMSPDMLRESDPEHQFLRFVETPKLVRPIIQQCTAGAVEWGGVSRPIRRRGHRLILQGTRESEEDDLDASLQVQEAARKWWKQELNCATAYLKERLSEKAGVSRTEEDGDHERLADVVEQRPSLAQVLEMLKFAARA